jgi:O-antigen/teichoic acid export membrane protein
MAKTAARRIGRSGSVAGFLLRGGTLSLAARILAVASGIGTQMLLARMLPPEELGAYFLTQSVVAVAALIGQLGLHRTAVRHIAESTGAGHPARARGFVMPTLLLAVGATGAVSVVYVLVGRPVVAEWLFASPVMAGATLATSVWVLTMGIQNVTAEVFRGFHAIGPASAFGGAVTSVITVSCFGAIYALGVRPSFDQVVWVAVAGTVANLMLSGLALRGLLAGPRERPQDAFALLLQSTAPLLGISVLHAAFAQIDLWMVGTQFSQDDVALYGAAKRLIRLLSLPLVIVNLVVPPLIAELYARGERTRLERAIRGASTLAGLPMLVALGLFIVAGATVLGFVYGEFYRAGAQMLLTLSLERAVFVWTGSCAITLMMTGHDRSVLWITLFTGVLTVVGCLVGARIWGALGVAVGAAFGSSVRNLLMWDAARRLCGIRTDVDLLHLRPMIETLRRTVRR